MSTVKVYNNLSMLILCVLSFSNFPNSILIFITFIKNRLRYTISKGLHPPAGKSPTRGQKIKNTPFSAFSCFPSVLRHFIDTRSIHRVDSFVWARCQFYCTKSYPTSRIEWKMKSSKPSLQGGGPTRRQQRLFSQLALLENLRRDLWNRAKV